MQVWRRLNPAGEGKPKIRDARKAAGLTMGDLARKAGVSVQTISSWERGKTGPGLAELTTLAAALGVKAPHLRGDTPHPPTWLRYLDDAVCGRWEMEGSDAVWAWVESFEPAEAVAVLFAMPDEEHPEWGVVARIGGAILRDRGRREEGHDAAIDVWRRQADGFRVERDGLQAESETRRGALDTALAGWYEQHGDGCPTCSFAGKMNEPGHDNGCTWSALQAHAEAGP
jgi:transcriptional regulator with XRE-family HTH domain